MRIFNASLAIATAVGLGCSPAIAQRSVDDAIKAIDSFRGDAKGNATATPASFVPPPRTIKDITAILDQQKPDPVKIAASRAAADAQPPVDLRKADLAQFYFQRSLAAGEVGRIIQRRDDAAEATRLGREAQSTGLAFFLLQLAFAESVAGNLKSAITVYEERLRVAMSSSPQSYTPTTSIAIIYARLGNLTEASRWLSRAEGYSLSTRIDGIWREVVADQIVQTRATIQEMSGNFAAAEAGYRRSIDLYDRRLIPNEEFLANSSRGGIAAGTFTAYRTEAIQSLSRVLMRQGRLIEAEAEARKALLDVLKRRGHYSPETATAIRTLATVIYEQGRYGEAEQLARAAVDIYENVGVDRKTFTTSSARQQIAEAQAAAGNWAQAAETYTALQKDIAGDDLLLAQFLSGNPGYAASLLKTGRGAAAVPVIETAIAERQKNLGDKAYATAQMRGWLGVAFAQTGQVDRAHAEFQAALPILLSASRQADDADDDGTSTSQRDQQLQAIVEAYLGLLADRSGSAAAGEAFRLADAVRGRSVQRALAASSARAAASDPALANLVRYEQDAQKQTAALQGLLTNILTRPSSEQDPGAGKKLREDIDKLRSARAALREEIEKRFPDYANLIDPKPVTVEQAQKSLRPGEALIATYAGTERLFVWAIPHQGAPTYASSKVSEVEVEKLVTDLRKALDPSAETLEQVPAFDVATAYRLYELLLKPVEAGWKDAKSLMIVPHKALGQLPTALLVTEKVSQPAKAGIFFAEYKNVPFLARKVAVTQLPSVASLATLRGLPAAPADRETFVAFGDPWFSPEQATQAKTQQVAQLQTRGKLVRRSAPKTDVDSAELALLPRLPDTAEEVRSIALALKADLSKDVFTGAAANEKAVKSMDLTKRKIVMFATHGLVPGDLNGLTQPALALSAPAVAGIDGDGLLTMEEVLALKLNADWVVLSACNTATGSGAGAEAVSGLGRAFFYAGTRALLVSNWPVETTSARILTTDLFRRQAEDAKLARGEAMRQAMVALIDSPGAIDDSTKQPMFSYAHPIFWAPFSVVGDGG